MFDKISRAAERAVAGVGRREFLGQLGRGAAVLAGALGGILATAGDAQAGGPWCCIEGFYCKKGRCPKGGLTVRCRDYGGCPL